MFDLGHNSGQDTMDYLSSGNPSTRVLAVDANPTLISNSARRFSDAIRQRRLKVINAGLVSHAGESLTFWVNSQNDLYSSFNEALGCRNKHGGNRNEKSIRKYCRPTTVPTRTCADLIEEFGSPTYMKIDIEGMDVACLNSLKKLDPDQRPRYVSMENVWLQVVQLLENLGYDGFKVVDQLNTSWNRPAEAKDGSGPWGEDAVDYESGLSWLSSEEILSRMPNMPRWKVWKNLNLSIWYDVHGRRSMHIKG